LAVFKVKRDVEFNFFKSVAGEPQNDFRGTFPIGTPYVIAVCRFLHIATETGHNQKFVSVEEGSNLLPQQMESNREEALRYNSSVY
jgi:hypothetical protein